MRGFAGQRKRTYAGCAAISLVAAALSACMNVPPAASPAGLERQALVPEGSAATPWPSRRWWEQYGSAELNALVASALRDAPTLAAAQARVEAAGAIVDTARAERRVQVAADAQLQRQRLSDNGLLPPRLLGFNWYSSSELGLTGRYNLDLGGRRLAEQRGAIARLAVAEADRAAAEMALGNAVVASYVAWQLDRAGLDLDQQALAIIDHELQIAGARANAGLSRADEALLLQQARASLVDRIGGYQTLLQLERVAIAALVRQTPDALPAFTVHSLPAPASALPAHARLDLMARRPDLIAARGRIEGALADSDVARAGYLPNLDLRALLGLSSRDIDRLLETGSWAPQFTAALNLPLFDAGRVRSRHAASQAALRAAVADYNDRLLAAAREVNVALVEREAAGNQLQLREQQVATAAQLRMLAQLRRDGGLADARPSLEATRQWLEAQEARLQTRQVQWTTELKLVRALGGGYGAADEQPR